jgi:hypothetical protein
MEETPSDMSGYTYQDPISGFFGGIFFIIIFVLVIIFVVIIMVGRAFGLTSEVAAPPAEAKKEKFKDGPPYPSCKTNGAFAMF